VRQALSIRYEFKRACRLEEEAESVERYGRNIRNPQVHVPPSLTATCQLQSLSLKAGRNSYIWSKADSFISWLDRRFPVPNSGIKAAISGFEGNNLFRC